MSELLSNPVALSWLGISAIALIPTALHFWQKMHKDELDASLKRDMIARGMSAEEIERVLAAESPG